MPTAYKSEVIHLATANLLNLALPNRVYYENRDPYNHAHYDAKITWLADKLSDLHADVIATQEVWDEAALKQLSERIETDYHYVSVPNAENKIEGDVISGGAQGTPSVGFISRLEVLSQKAFYDIPQGFSAEIPEIGVYDTFARSPVLLTVKTNLGQKINILNVHLKSKRPKFIQDDNGNVQEDTDDPALRARGRMRSLFIRAVEATAIRSIIVDELMNNHTPLVLMGDVNDASHSVTTQLMAETSEVKYDKSSRDTALFNAYEYQTKHKLGKDVAYSHIFQGHPEVLDQIFVSEEFLPNSRFSIGQVLQVDYFNDYLMLPRNKRHTDHGIVRARIKITP